MRPALPPALAEIVLRCLARDRDERYASCAEVDCALATKGTADAAGATLAADAEADADADAPPAPRKAPPPDDPRERTVAVVPFRNFGPPEDAYFVEGLTEDLVDTLATVRGLRVRGRAYAEASDRDVVDTGRRLGVDVVVNGSVRRAGDAMRVNARLIGVVDGFQLWSSRFDRPAGAAFALNDEVAHAIAAALSAERSGTPRPQPSDASAIDLHFRAKHAIGRFWSTEGQAEAVTLFKDALSRAPNDPTILAGHVHAQIGRNLFAPLAADESRVLVRRALAAGGRIADPWVALGAFRFNDGDDPPGAIRALRRALEIAPSSSDAHDLAGRILLEADEWEDGLPLIERALWLDPFQRWARVDRMRAAALSGDWALASELFESGPGPEWIGHRAFHYARLWSWPGAPSMPDYVFPEGIAPRFLKLIGQYLRARECRRTGAELPFAEIRDTMASLTGNPGPQSRLRRFFGQMAAEQAAICGHHEGALELVAASVEAGLIDRAWMNRQALLDPLRADARFEALRRTVEARAARVRDAWHMRPETLEEALASLA